MDELRRQPQESFLFSEDVTINYEVQGKEGPPVVFLHGFGASLRSWDDLRPYLPPGRVYYFLDLKGFGLSSKPRDSHYAPDDQASIVIAFLDRLALERATLAGHSYGGGIALLAYLELQQTNASDKISSLILVDSAGYDAPLPFFLRALRIPFVNVIVKTLVSPRYQARHTLTRLFWNKDRVTDERIDRYAAYYTLSGSTHSFISSARKVLPKNHDSIVANYAGIEAPTLLVWGAHDPILPLAHAYDFREDLSRSTLVVVPDCGHIPHEEKPEETARAISQFLNEVYHD